jgi:hypothetical protein
MSSATAATPGSASQAAPFQAAYPELTQIVLHENTLTKLTLPLALPPIRAKIPRLTPGFPSANTP